MDFGMLCIVWYGLLIFACFCLVLRAVASSFLGGPRRHQAHLGAGEEAIHGGSRVEIQPWLPSG